VESSLVTAGRRCSLDLRILIIEYGLAATDAGVCVPSPRLPPRVVSAELARPQPVHMGAMSAKAQ
jgi:hypothetical protein